MHISIRADEEAHLALFVGFGAVAQARDILGIGDFAADHIQERIQRLHRSPGHLLRNRHLPAIARPAAQHNKTPIGIKPGIRYRFRGFELAARELDTRKNPRSLSGAVIH